jgi:hypothetical protein
MNLNARRRVGPRRACAAAAMALATLGGSPAAQTAPSLDEVLKRAGDYVVEFKRQLSGIVAEETYVQQIKTAGNAPISPFQGVRKLRSDLLLVRPAGGAQYVEYRDVFEVDGDPVRDRQERLTALLRDGAGDQMGRIIQESARYNIGRIFRNINTPLLPLTFLDPAFQPRFRFRRAPRTTADVDQPRNAAERDVAVFRVATEMWTVEFRERDRPTIIKRPGGGNLPVHGRFWINPETGAVLMSELIAEGDVATTITVSYQSEPLMGFLVPVEMRERYIGQRDYIDGRATYGRFRAVPADRPGL